MKRAIIILAALAMLLTVPATTWDTCDTDTNCCILWDDCSVN